MGSYSPLRAESEGTSFSCSLQTLPFLPSCKTRQGQTEQLEEEASLVTELLTVEDKVEKWRYNGEIASESTLLEESRAKQKKTIKGQQCNYC